MDVLSLLFLTDLVIMSIAFILFRVFYILKPSVIYYSQFYNGAYGIMLDDLLAGLCKYNFSSVYMNIAATIAIGDELLNGFTVVTNYIG